jgi:cytochrome c553
MQRRPLIVSVFLAALLAAPAAHAQPEPVDRVQVMAHSCLACHGANGQGPGHMPSISDLTAEGIVNKLTTYRNDEDEDATVMNRHAPAYSEDELRAIAQYIANLD